MHLSQMKPKELEKRLANRKEELFFLLDVRNENEQEICLIQGTDKLIPVANLQSRVLEIEDKFKNQDVIVYCRSGVRSMKACEVLQNNGFQNLYNLEGGILAYSDVVDPSLAKY